MSLSIKAGRRYRLEHSTDMANWKFVEETGSLAADSPVIFSHQPDATRAFYRLRVSIP